MIRKHSLKFRQFKTENAQTFLEFALVFPLILVITYGMIEFGRMMFIYAAVTGAAREGARYGAAAGTIPNSDLPYYADCSGIKNAVQRGAILTPIANGNITIKYDNGYGGSKTWASCPPRDTHGFDPILLGDRITVQVKVNYQPILGNFLGVTGFLITSQNSRTILSSVEIGQ